MKRLIIAALLLALILAPLQTLGVLKKGGEQAQDVVSSSEAQSLFSKIKAELPGLGEKVSNFLARLFPQFNIGVSEVE
jgi:hypothetical protein